MTSTTLHLSKSGATVACRAKGAGELLVLLHGVGMQSAAWGPQLDALHHDYRVIAVDLPGHGGSDPLPQGSALPAFVAWLDDVIATLNLGPVNLAGHSMGALIAAGFAVTHPNMTYRVALLNGVYRRDDTAGAAVLAGVWHPHGVGRHAAGRPDPGAASGYHIDVRRSAGRYSAGDRHDAGDSQCGPRHHYC